LVWTANMSDFCRDDEACHARVTIGDGALEVLRLWRIVKRGWRVATSNDPFWYLVQGVSGGLEIDPWRETTPAKMRF